MKNGLVDWIRLFRIRIGLFLCLGLILGCADRRSVAVLGLEAEGLSPSECAWVETALVESFSKRRPVVAPFSVRQKLGEACQAAACNQETARALGAADVVSGRLTRAEGSLRLSLERYRAADGAINKKTWRAETPEKLAELLRREAPAFIATR